MIGIFNLADIFVTSGYPTTYAQLIMRKVSPLDKVDITLTTVDFHDGFKCSVLQKFRCSPTILGGITKSFNHNGQYVFLLDLTGFRPELLNHCFKGFFMVRSSPLVIPRIVAWAGFESVVAAHLLPR